MYPILIITSVIIIIVLLLIYVYSYNISDKNIDNNSSKNNIDSFELIVKTDELKKKDEKIKMIIFTATWCGACNMYRKNIHHKIEKELKNEFTDISFEFIVDDPENKKIGDLQKYYEIKYFPTIILYKNEKYKKLPMNEPIVKDNIVKLINNI
jgi:thiol-disulfide isomerase/thioredoxin